MQTYVLPPDKHGVAIPPGLDPLLPAMDLRVLSTGALCKRCGCVRESHTVKYKKCTVCTRFDNICARVDKSKKDPDAPTINMGLKRAELAALYQRLDRMVCYYCGLPELYCQMMVESPFRSRDKRRRRADPKPVYRFGIDRMFAERGYSRGNIVFSCWTCNGAKLRDDAVSFVKYRADGLTRQWVDRARALGLFIPDDYLDAMLAARRETDRWNLSYYPSHKLTDVFTYNEGLRDNENWRRYLCVPDQRPLGR